MTPVPPPPAPVSVRGGTGGFTATYADIVAMARRLGGVSTDTLSAALHLHGYLIEFGAGFSTILDPLGVAEFEADLVDALDGLHGLSWAGMQAGVLDGELRAAAAAYDAADRLDTDLGEVLRGLTGLPGAIRAATDKLIATGNPILAAQAGIASDPEAADLVVSVLGIPATLSLAAGALPDGHGDVRDAGLDRSGIAAVPPRRLRDILGGLAQRSDRGRHGAIDVRILTMPDGSRRVIVDITGTKSWDPLPNHDITSLTTNGRALVGKRTAYEQGVLKAMRAAGVRRSDKVMLVGHSEGGMVAVTTARDATRSGEFDITHVVTAGAPIGITVASLPSRVNVLALENTTDVVPHLDGVANPDQTNVTTVSGTRGNNTITGDHDVARSYVPIAGDAEASSNRSIRDFLRSARGYLGATNVRTHAYQIVRN